MQELILWQEACEIIDETYPELTHSQRIKRIIVKILNTYVTDLITTSEEIIRDRKFSSIEDVKACAQETIQFSSSMIEHNNTLQRFLRENLYQHSRVQRMANKAKRFIREIFNEYNAHPDTLPEDYQEWAQHQDVGIERAIADYIAGMTDRFAQEEYIRLFYPFK